MAQYTDFWCEFGDMLQYGAPEQNGKTTLYCRVKYMKVIAFSSATLLSLFPLEAFTPLGGINERYVIEAIGQRYNFGTSPTLSSRAELEKTGLVFESGFFVTELGEVIINRLAIHNDGVVVRTNKSEQARAFFDDLTNWLVEHHSCRKITHTPRYLSEVVVDFESPASNMLANYDKIIDIIVSNVSEKRGATGATFGALVIEFVTQSVAMPKFIIERREQSAVEDERYFCSAPLTTDRHLQVLEEIERLFL